jgi:DNA-binding transcriptional ArsR family regulator
MVPHDQALDAEPREDAVVAVDDVFGALADEHRRFVLYHLCEQPRSSVDALADALADRTSDGIRPRSPPGRRDEIRTSLHHAHLPHLEDRSFVTYDRESGSVTLATLSPDVTALLALAMEMDEVAPDVSTLPSGE